MHWRELMFGGAYGVCALFMWAGVVGMLKTGVIGGKWKIDVTKRDESPRMFGFGVVVYVLGALIVSLVALARIINGLSP